MMRGDTYKAAQKAAKKFKDGRVMQFYDPQQLSGQVFAASLGHSDKVAWDVYLFFPPRTAWGGLPPPPEMFMHQLRDSWADQDCLFEKDRLRLKLTETMKSLFPKCD
jgi:hypothetical protein